ncbi:MAG TPA: diacylglycerol kinase family protein [Immundisolibacter sp.]|nr:diacylglycerol kinase family protein [Immundisolibacter sp.]
MAQTPEQIEAALGELAAAGTSCVVLNGGDGTAQAALTTLSLRSPFASPPTLLVLAGGTTNMSAYDLGSHSRPARLLQRLLAGRLAVTRRRMLCVREADGTTRCGFFFTAGGLPQAVRDCRAFRETSTLPGMRSALGTAAWISGRLLRLLAGREPFEALALNYRPDAEPVRRCEALLLLASTHERLALGLTPWWCAGGGPIRATLISRPARRLARALPGLLRGRPPAFANAAAGYESRAITTLHLTPTGGYALDGEDYFPPAGSELVVDAGPEFEFLRP